MFLGGHSLHILPGSLPFPKSLAPSPVSAFPFSCRPLGRSGGVSINIATKHRRRILVAGKVKAKLFSFPHQLDASSKHQACTAGHGRAPPESRHHPFPSGRKTTPKMWRQERGTPAAAGDGQGCAMGARVPSRHHGRCIRESGMSQPSPLFPQFSHQTGRAR